MVRFRSSNKRPIDSRKHIVDSQGGIVAGTQTVVNIIDSVDSPVLANEAEVRTGARVNSIFLNVQIAATGTAALANVYFYIAKNPGNAISNANFPEANVVGASDLKRLVFHQEMTMTEKNTTAIPRTLFKGVLKLPRHMQRMGYDDAVNIFLFSPGVNFDYCFQTIYKDYT